MAQASLEADVRANRLVDFTGGRNLFLVSTEEGIGEAIEAMLDDERNDEASFAIVAPLGDGRWRVESITGTTADSADYDHAESALAAVHAFCSAAPAPTAVLSAEIAATGPTAHEAVSFFLRSEQTCLVLAASISGLGSLAPFLGQESEIVIDLADRVETVLV